MPKDVKILHTADTHLGYRQYHSEVRRKDYFKAFELVVNDAIEMQVNAVVHAGDLFDSRNPTLEDLLETINILYKLKAATIPFFGIVGNHENKQNTQWLDLLEQMGLASRLGKKPQLLEDVAIYGIDSVPRSKIPLFDYSGFEAPESQNYRKLLVMHQIVQPFPYAEWNCEEIFENFPFDIDAILLGDYHKYEKFKIGNTWVTYPGSTERNSVSESEARSYNIITVSADGLEISKRTIPTRNFLFIPVKVNQDEKPYEQIFSAINEHSEELPESVAFLEISGDSGVVLSFSEIEEYLLNKGTLVPKVIDQRKKEALPEEISKITFADPERAVSDEIKRMHLNDGGLIIDEIVRSKDISKSRVDEETERRLSDLIEIINFKDPDFRIENHISPSISSTKEEKSRPSSDAGRFEDLKTVLGTEPIEKPGSKKPIIINSEVPEPVFPIISKPDSPEKNLEIVGESSEKELKFRIDDPKKPENEPENEVESFSESELEQKTGFSNENIMEGKKEFSEEKSRKLTNVTGKIPKKGQKKGKEKSAKPRQYNLGDYL